MISKRLVCAIVALAAACTAVLSAQSAGVGTGAVVGVVTDPANLPAPGVQVTISGVRLMAPRKVTTQADGGYRFTSLPPGEYDLTFALSGFARLERRAYVSLGFTLTLDVTLVVESRREDVAVHGVFDRHSTAIAQSFDATQLASLPGSRSLGGLFAVTQALALPVVEVGGGAGIVAGDYGAYGRNNSPRHTIEGVVVTGLFGAGFTPDYGSFEEVSVLTAAHGAEWPTSGIHTDVATKSGSNQYRGTIYGAAEHRRLQSANVDAGQIRRGVSAGGGLAPAQVNQLWRDLDVNADVGGFIRKDRVWWYTSARFQDIASRLVNFPVEPYESRLTNYSGKATFRASARQTVVLYGQRGLNHQPNRLDPFPAVSSDLSAGTAINETADSTADQRNAAWLWKGEWNGNVRDSTVFEVRAGQFGWNQRWTPHSSSPRFEDVETLVVAGGNRDWQSGARRNQLTGTISHFTQNRTGRHYLRSGAEALRFLAEETWFSGYPGNVLHVLSGGDTSSVFLFDTPSSSRAGVWSWSAYLSDAWQPTGRLTLTAGLRYDRYRLFLPAQEHPVGSPTARQFAAVSSLANWAALTPRLSAVFDAKRDGTTLVKFSFGRYRVAPNATLGFNSNPNSNQWWSQYDWADLNQDGVWQRGEEARRQRRRGGDAIESMSADLELPLLDEAGAWIEQSLRGGVAVRAGAIWRLERFPYVRQNVNQPFEAFTVPVAIRDRGPDGVAGTADDGPVFTAYDLSPDYIGQPVVNEVRNVAGASSEYFTLEIAATRQTRGRWTLGAGFAETWNGDHASGYSGQPLRNNAYPLTPNDLLNAGAGGRYEFTTWVAKAYGTFTAPWDLHITPVLRHQAGQPFGRTQTTERGQLRYASSVTLLMEPVGTRRLDPVTLIDLRIEKSLRLGGRRVSTFIDVFNALNVNPEQNAIWASGASFLRPLTIVPPRIARLGLSVNW